MPDQLLSESIPSASMHIPTAWFRTIVQRLHQTPQMVAVGTLGVNQQRAGQCDLLVRSFQMVSEREARSLRRQEGPRYEMSFVPHTVVREAAWESLAWAWRFDEDPPYPSVCVLQLGARAELGAFTGIYTSGDHIIPIRQLQLVGAGMARFDAVDWVQPVPLLGPEEAERWSRLIGAIGGSAVWRRLTELALAVVGVGRTGSLVAAALARLGCRRVTLIDPDRVEQHNVDAMDLVTTSDLGRFKAEVVAQRMRELNPHLEVRPLTHSVFSHEAHAALKSAQVIICTVDNPTARLATGAMATAYLKPWLDLGTGVFRPGGSELDMRVVNLQMGADVRLVLPGDGCVLCWGGVADLSQALRDWGQSQAPRDWRMERAGSLRSLNMLAVATGLRWLEELVMGRFTTSTWQRVEINDQGMAEWRAMPRRADPACRLCAQMGRGDAISGLVGLLGRGAPHNR